MATLSTYSRQLSNCDTHLSSAAILLPEMMMVDSRFAPHQRVKFYRLLIATNMIVGMQLTLVGLGNFQSKSLRNALFIGRG